MTRLKALHQRNPVAVAPAFTLTAAAMTALVLTLAAGVPARADITASRLDTLVERGMADWQIPGLAIAVFENGEVTYRRGFGRTALATGAPVTTDTFFINASTTKAMVAAGLLMLIDEGRVDLDDRLIDHLPEVHFEDPALTAQISVRDLLTHRTGLPSTDFWTFNQGMPLADQIPRLRFVEPVAGLRERKIYQNTMYELIGLLIERVSGKPWEVFLEERLWRPIGMRTVATRNAIPEDAVAAEPFEVFDGTVRSVNHSLRGLVSDAAGSAWSSIDDMVLWVEFLLRGGVTAGGERLLSEAALKEMFTPQQLVRAANYYPTHTLTQPHWISYGLGWYQQDFQGRKIDYHTGSLNGATAIAGLDRENGRAVVVLANLGGAELRHALLWEVMDLNESSSRRDWLGDVLALYNERSAQRAQRRAELEAGRLDAPPSLPLPAYAGRYDSERAGPLELTVDGDAIRLDTRVRTYRLTPWHAETFLLEHPDWTTGGFARFSLTPGGEIDGLSAFGQEFTRVSESDSAP